PAAPRHSQGEQTDAYKPGEQHRGLLAAGGDCWMISRNDNPRLLSAAILIKRIGRGNGELRRDDWKLPPLLIESGAIKGKIMTPPPSPGAQTSSPHDFALFLPRIASAAAFLYHGSAILFGAFAATGPQNFAAYLHVPVI